MLPISSALRALILIPHFFVGQAKSGASLAHKPVEILFYWGLELFYYFTTPPLNFAIFSLQFHFIASYRLQFSPAFAMMASVYSQLCF
jgi:hypothetical protein